MTLKRPWRLIVRTSDKGYADDTYDTEREVNEAAESVLTLLEKLPAKRSWSVTIYKNDEEYSKYEGKRA